MRLGTNQAKVALLLSVLAFGCLTVLRYSEPNFFSNFDWQVFWIVYVGTALSVILLGATLLVRRLGRKSFFDFKDFEEGEDGMDQ